jgi:argininosuccinate synthase
MKTRPNRVVLAYSGGLNSAVSIPWLAENMGAEIVTLTLDMGQGGELEEVRDRALATGAVRAHVLDVGDEFGRDFIVRALKADATADGGQPMPSALARPVIARKLAEIAQIEQASTVAHGSAGAGRPSRLETAVRALAPNLTILAPARDWEMSRLEAIEYAAARNIAVPVTIDQPLGVDANVWGRVTDLTAVDSCAEPPDDIYTLTTPPARCPDEPAFVEVAFERGVPTAVNGVPMPTPDLIATVGMIAAAHGVGRLEVVEHQAPGVRTRIACEAPAAFVLHTAHAELHRLTTTPEAFRFSRRASRQYADLIDQGMWFTPLREALDAYVDKTSERVTGAIRLKLFKGDCRVVGRKAVEPKGIGKRLRIVSKTH